MAKECHVTKMTRLVHLQLDVFESLTASGREPITIQFFQKMCHANFVSCITWF